MFSQPLDSETIAAISTPPGSGGIGIIRISGPRALAILQLIFVPRDSSCRYKSHLLYYGRICDPIDQHIMDEVLAVFMAAPRTYTREDVVEIHCHGNFLVLQSILELILQHDVRLAEAGEFTKRAYLNGRMDLTQAEAVIDVLAAKTRKGLDLAVQQLAGALYERVDAIRRVLVEIRALVEVAIDFPDEDIEIVDYGHLADRLRTEVLAPLDILLRHADQGRIFREGVSVVIMGLPNVGKSSLLNTLLQEERALVTEIPGTTRDTIEEYVDIRGVPVRLVDTAGIRHGAEEVEEMGIRRAHEQMARADLVLFMVDLNRELSEADRELYAAVSHKPVVLVANKNDVVDGAGPNLSEFTCTGRSLVRISARTQQGIEELKHAIFTAVTGGREQWQEEACAPNVRHRQALVRARAAAELALDGVSVQQTSDLLAIDLQECLNQLDEIVGVTTTEDVLDVIFEQFCLGK
ncbi:MAG: tRNA uridine-5-carboxymethylaminomethyl(34) synthesis GTPase MnmE [Desulfobulbaceae bacterium]|uniref:tRNA modification GTPase MnmE n=1 Tax=Candidatus Desulfatifera sulfidica TaxID=2841691 RepID=A0A8J6TB35_9BACT|nr:tRNA uridine-5-carboxymethylaminomethyl(34) synthesis GTPase MnmE [Candidatus Desulfatifera sulfidica]